MTRRVAVSMGDPAGIGPEVTLKACASLADKDITPVLFGDAEHLGAVAQTLDVPLPSNIVAAGDPLPAPAPGRPTEPDARAALAALDDAAAATLSGDADALATAPLSKEGIAAFEPSFRGHTEYLAGLAGIDTPVMLFAGIKPAVALLTTHLPLASAIAAVQAPRIGRMLEHLDAGWSRWFESRPIIGVAGLNPHAGEFGLLGSEDDQHIRPAILTARAAGIDARGPYPADSISKRTDIDVILAMYHDQGTIIAKNGDTPSVNTTLGLPYPRTSPDHGVAYDIAGQGIADATAMAAAIRLAADMAERR